MKKSHLKQFFSFCIVLFVFCTNPLNAQTSHGITKSPNSPFNENNYDKPKLFDRFGNEFAIEELRFKRTPTSNPIPTSYPLWLPPPVTMLPCNAGLFNIEFAPEALPTAGFYNAAYRNVVCQVFRDISRLFYNVDTNNTLRVNILVASEQALPNYFSGSTIPAGIDVVGSGFELVQPSMNNGFIDNTIYSTIRSGKSAYHNLEHFSQYKAYDYFHGYLAIRLSGKNWFTNLTAKNITTTQDDLYSAILSEAMHMLGLYSQINHNGNSVMGNNLYSRYDNFLYKNTTATKVLSQNSSSFIITKNLTNLALGCTSPNNVIFNGNSLVNQSVYTSSLWQTGSNLSHFGCSGTTPCNTGNALPTNTYTLIPCRGLGANYFKRYPHQNEVKALCDIGYKLKVGVNGFTNYGESDWNDSTFGNIFKSYTTCSEPCVAVGKHDTFYKPYYTTFTINFSSILGNDLPSGAVLGRFSLLDTSLGTITTNASSFTFTPKFGRYSDRVSFVYYPKCNTSTDLGNATFVTVYYTYTPQLQCENLDTNNCNYICNGTFEEVDNPDEWGNFAVFSSNTINTIDLFRDYGTTRVYRNHVQNFWQEEIFPNPTPCVRSGAVKTSYKGGNHYIGLEGRYDYSEGLHFKLRKPIIYDTTKEFRIRFKGNLAGPLCPTLPIVIIAGDSIPKSRPNALFDRSPFKCLQSFCSPVMAATSIAFNPVWVDYDMPLSFRAKNDTVTDIVVIVWADSIKIDEGSRYGYLDNFEIYEFTKQKINISTIYPPNYPCSDTVQEVKFAVCMKHNTSKNSDTVYIHLNLPAGITVDAGSDFNSNGTYKYPPLSILDTVCDTLTLRYKVSNYALHFSSMFELGIGYSTNAYCTEDKSDIFKIYPSNNSLTFLKTASKLYPALGDTVTFNIQISNPSALAILGLNLMDEVPSGIKLLSYNGLNLVGTNSLQQLFDISPAVSSTQPSLINFSYTGISMSDCRISTKATLTSIYNLCNELTSILNLNDTMVGTVPKAAIAPQDFVWCGSPIPFRVVDSSTTYTYQWYRNDTLISGATSRNYAATPSAQYSVKVSNNGCITKVEAPPFDTTYTVDYVTTDATCTGATGSISLNPLRGIPPFSYIWSGSPVINSSRNNLIGGIYHVTVTDSIGCTKAISIMVGIKYDTLKVVFDSLLLPTCTASNGKIYITTSKGTAPYNYLWSDGSTIEDRLDIKKSFYKLTITDTNGCKWIDSFDIPSIDYTIDLADSIVPAACSANSGAIYLTPINGASPYQYLWGTGETVKNRIGLSPDTFHVSVTDQYGCKGIDSFIVTKVDTFINLLDTVISPKCFGDVNGSISLNPQGGTLSYNYLWNSGNTAKKRTGLAPGVYSVTITDANGCKSEKTYTFQNPPEIYATGYGCYSYCDTNSGCAGMTIVSGRAPYKYLWLDGDTSTYRVNLSIGDYSLYIEDSMGCQSPRFSYYVDNLGSYYTQNINFIETVFHKCSTTLDLKAPSSPYAYWWSTGDNTQTITNVTIGSTYVLAMYDTSGGTCYFLDTIIPVGKLDIGLGTLYPNASSLAALLPDITSFPGYNTIKYQGFNVLGDFEIDINMRFDQCKFEAASGVGIYHSYPGTDLVFESCQFYSCGSDMWKGIENDNDNSISLYDCTVEDALYGLEVEKGNYNVNGSHFNYNYVGIYVSPDPSYSYTSANYTTPWGNIRDCHFLGHQNKLIKNPYSGIGVTGMYSLQHPSNAFVNTSWAGIIIADRPFLIPSGCNFKNLTNGLLAYNVDWSLADNITYDSINGVSSIGNTAVNGVCYYGNSNWTHPWLRPRYNITNLSPTASICAWFNNSETAIEVNNGVYNQIIGAQIENVQNGIISTNVVKTNIFASSVINSTSGIKAVNSVFNGFTNTIGMGIGSQQSYVPGINQNTIVNTGSNNAHGAIELQHTNWLDTFYYNYTVSENAIDLHGRNGFGVYVANLKANFTQSYSRISLNNLFLHNPTTTFKGMHFANNNSMRISLNQVSSNNPNTSAVLTQSPLAMHFEKTEANVICNEVNNIHVGMQFTDLCTKTNFEKNHFQDHYGGLVLDASSFLQNQDNKGNSWTGSYGTMRAARNDQPFTNTKFKVGLGAPLECNPPSVQPASGFFSSAGFGDNPSCIDVTYAAPPQSYDGAYLQQQTADYPEYNTALNYQREAALYRDLKAIESSLAPNSAEKNYIIQRANTNIDRFLDIEKQAIQLFTFSASDRLQDDVLDHQADTYLDSLRKILAELNTLPHAQQQTLRQTIASLTQQLYTTKVYKHQLLEPIYQSGLSESNQLVQLNDAIEPINQSERLQKLFNALYLPTYAIGNTMLTAEQKEQYRILANQCPRINGDVVFRSRAILSAQEASVYYDDSYICDTTSHTVKHEPPTNTIDSPYCTFAPNPAHTQAVISFRTIPNEELIIRLATLEGLTVYESTNLVTSQTFTIPTSNIQNGLYFIQIVSVQNNETVYSGQLQILHE